MTATARNPRAQPAARLLRSAWCALALAVLPTCACCPETKVSYACSACVKEHGCKYCTAHAGAPTEPEAEQAARVNLCASLVGVPMPGVDTRTKESCLAAPPATFFVACDKVVVRRYGFEDIGY